MIFNIPLDMMEELLLSGAHFGSRALPIIYGKVIEEQLKHHNDCLVVEYPENAQHCEVYTQDGWKQELERRVIFSERRKANPTIAPELSKKELTEALIKAATEGNQSEVERISKLI